MILDPEGAIDAHILLNAYLFLHTTISADSSY
jgi:hypothetical protein